MDSVVLIKYISSLLYPIGVVVLGVVLSLWFGLLNYKKLSGFFKYTSIIVLLLASNPQLARFAMTSLEAQHPQRSISDIAKHDLIVVLGGGLSLPIPPAKSVQLGSGSDRFWHATQLFKAGKANKIMLAGGNVYPQAGVSSEAYYAAELLAKWGVPKGAIVIEGKSRTTQQNFANILDYIQRNKIRSVLLVTSAYHMPRAIRTLQRELEIAGAKGNPSSLKITASSADIIIRQDSTPALLSWIPSAQAVVINTMVVHEYYGKWFVDLKALMASG